MNDSDDERIDLPPQGEWHAPHGTKTRIAAWVILTAFVACFVAIMILVAMLLIK